MQDEISFLILDPTLILVAGSLLTIFHPGLFFPQMRNGYRKEETNKQTGETSESANETPMVGTKA